MSGSLSRIFVVFWKEVSDNLRDRRSMFSALMSALIGPIMILALIMIMGRTIFADLSERPLQVPVQGAQYAPTLVQFLEENGVELLPAPQDPETEVRNGNYDLILIVPEGFGEDFSAGRPATVRVVLDSSRQSSLAVIERVRGLLESYNSQIGMLRLLARGISPTTITPLSIERMDMATPESQGLMFLNMLPYFIVLVVFVGGMYVIIDTTAGERERGSLEPLLINPVARWEFVVGKLMAALPFATVTLLLTLLAFAAAFNVFPVENYIDIPMSVDVRALTGIFLLALPMVLLASALQMVVATFTRSFKEAQTYVAFLPLIPAMPGIGLAFMPVKGALWNMLIPTFGQQILINQMMRGELVSTTNILISTVATLVLSFVLIYLAVRLYQRERVMFGTK